PKPTLRTWRKAVKLDLNFPDFQKDLFKLQKNQLQTLIKSLNKLAKLDIDQLRNSSGFNLEKIKNLKTIGQRTIYSIRISKSFRATLTIDGDYLRFISLHSDHDSAYF
ncbi:MAG: hypothetical protein WAK95_11575, partial [Desulfobacterales bacterium]